MAGPPLSSSTLRPPVQQGREGRCSVNEDQHFRGVCVGGWGGWGQVFCKRRPTL